jgi:RNA polymerase sigma-70 factor, ECF subfamily
MAGSGTAADRLAAFDEHRPLLFSIAYRMLGSAVDAEDLLQDAYLRWEQADTSHVRSAKDYLSTMVTRLSIDHLRSARVRREVYMGPWLPEPLVGVDAHDPLATTVLSESLSTAFLVLLERLTPTQRAAFLLRDVFEYSYASIARILKTTQANARQLVRRAKRSIAEGRPRYPCDPRVAADLTQRFLTACSGGDVAGLVAILAEDAVAWADGGDRFHAARRPVIGADRIARFVASVVKKWSDSGDVQRAPVNGGVGLVFSLGGRVRAVMTVDARDDRISGVYIIVNPEKLGTKSRHDRTHPFTVV